MIQLPLFQSPTWTVSELTRYVRQLLESDYHLQDVWVEGEVSNISRPSSGHLYFTLKDAEATLRCVMWRASVVLQAYLPQDGEAVEVHGHVSVYEAGGQYQLYADAVRPAGEGVLYQEFLRLKAKLEAEGLFDPERKKPIPYWPERIGLVTSPTGAAVRDILNTLRRRYPLVEVILVPTAVQGPEAPPGIVSALQTLNSLILPDVILVARGGGSLEDLWAFNDERVVRAVAASHIPVISGVGHETDFTLTDFAADLRAPTPTAAAEMATPDQRDLLAGVTTFSERFQRAMQAWLNSGFQKLSGLGRLLQRHSPLARIHSDQQRLDDLLHRAAIALTHRMQLQKTHVSALEQRLVALNPLAVLSRGYSLVTDEQGGILRRVEQVHLDQSVQVRLSDGRFGARVTSVQAGEHPSKKIPLGKVEKKP
ncbi:MAG: exodeoxyribonuclease VII large subunit [Chloroflexota bacterium]